MLQGTFLAIVHSNRLRIDEIQAKRVFLVENQQYTYFELQSSSSDHTSLSLIFRSITRPIEVRKHSCQGESSAISSIEIIKAKIHHKIEHCRSLILAQSGN